MLTLSVKVGQAVQIGDVAVIKVLERAGRRVGLQFATSVSPITLIPSGIIPDEFAVGIAPPRHAPRILDAVA